MAFLYDNASISNSKYVPKFIGSNYDTIKGAADTLDQRYRRNKELTDRIAIAAAQDQYLPQDQIIKDTLTNQVKEDINNIASSPESFENSSTSVAKLARDYATNPERLAAIRNFQEVEKYKDYRQKLGPYALDFNPLDTFKGTIDPETKQVNIFNPDVEKQLDYDNRKETLFNQITANTSKEDYKKLKGVLEGFVGQDIRSGISDNRIKNYLNEAVIRYKQTPEYKQELRKLTELDGVPKDVAEKSIEDSLMAVGRERVFNIYDQRVQQDPLEIARLRMAGKQAGGSSAYEETPGYNYTVPTMSNSKLNRTGLTIGQSVDPVVQRYNNFRKNSKTGDYIINGRTVPSTPATDNEYKKLQEDYNKYLVDNKVGEYPTLEGKDKENYDKIVETLNPNITEKDKYGDIGHKLVQDYFNSLDGQEFVEKTPLITGDFVRRGESGRSTRADATDDLKSSYIFRSFLDPETGETISGSDPDIIKKMGFDNRKDFENSLQVAGEFSPQNLFPTITKGNNAFVDPLGVKVGNKLFAVSRSKGELNSPEYVRRKIINDAYQASKELPGIKNTVDLVGLDGKPRKFNIIQSDGVYILESLDGKIQVTVDNLDNLPQALAYEYGKQQ